jgi:hypothetical protein
MGHDTLEALVDAAVLRMRKAGGAPGVGPRPAEGFTWTVEAQEIRDREVVPLRAALREAARGG